MLIWQNIQKAENLKAYYRILLCFAEFCGDLPHFAVFLRGFFGTASRNNPIFPRSGGRWAGDGSVRDRKMFFYLSDLKKSIKTKKQRGPALLFFLLPSRGPDQGSSQLANRDA
ncbi:hypothetical protein [Pelobium manganitolerans]|uniref:hypothetical protein n=1 Tax=Pelobium manganitolerans TaxID=1842495 RepID=UPI003FA39D14